MASDRMHRRQIDTLTRKVSAYEQAIRLTLRLNGICPVCRKDDTQERLRRVLADHATGNTVAQADVDISGRSEGVKK